MELSMLDTNGIDYKMNEEAYLTLIEQYITVYENALKMIISQIYTLGVEQRNVNGHIVLALRYILVLLDGIKTLYITKNTESAQLLLRSITEEFAQLSYFLQNPDVVEEKNALYNLCSEISLRNYEKENKKYESKRKFEKSIFSQEIIDKIINYYPEYRYLTEKKQPSWYQSYAAKEGITIKYISQLFNNIKLFNGEKGSILYDIIYRKTSMYGHGSQCNDVLYKIDDKFLMISHHCLSSSSVYIIALELVMTSLVLSLCTFYKTKYNFTFTLQVNKLNNQRILSEKIKEMDNTLPIYYDETLSAS